MARKYSVSRHAKGWAVYDDAGQRVSGLHSRIDGAQAMCDRMQRREDKKAVRTIRPCMCCRTAFESEGIHNRLCDRCRRVGLDLRMAG